MILKDVIVGLRSGGHERVLVTGPQRSGTTIAAKILASELKYRFFDEGDPNRLIDVMLRYWLRN